MQAIILAAGMGKRLGELTQNNTKCMVKVNGNTLIDRLLIQLRQFEIKKVIIVTGYKGDSLRKYIQGRYDDMELIFINNPIYEKTNNIYSLFLAGEYLRKEETLLFESDLILGDEIIKKVINDPNPDIVVTAKYEQWMDGTMVTIDDESNIKSFISKKDFDFNNISNYYKTVNIYKFSKDFSNQYYLPFLKAYTVAFGNNEYYEQVLKVITNIDNCNLKALVIENENWYEIDDIQDLDIAETIFSTDSELFKYQKRFGGYWRFPKITDFCYLVNPFFPPEKMMKEIAISLSNLIQEYPSGLDVNSLLIAKYFRLNQKYVCPGNGAAELIKSFLKYETGKLGIIFPTFEEYPNRYDKERIVGFNILNKSFSYDENDVIDFFSTKDISILVLINPDNPSGNLIDKKGIVKILDWGLENNIKIIIDESFIDFADASLRFTMLNNFDLFQYPNLIVIKSISKSYGVPGLRLGMIASSDESFIQRIKGEVSIWNINSIAEFYMQIFNKYEFEYQLACDNLVNERKLFYEELNSIPFLRVIPSQANYFLCEIKNNYSSKELSEILLKSHFLIKDCTNKNGMLPGQYIRIAIRNRKDNSALVRILKTL